MINEARAILARWIRRLLQALLALFLPLKSPLLRPEDQHLLKYYVAIHRVVQPVMHKTFILLRPNDGKTVKEQLFDLPNYSKTKYNKDFYKPEREKLNINESSEHFDITLLSKLLQLICNLAKTIDDSWSTVGTLENSLMRLKNHRNSLAHDDLALTLVELKEIIVDLKHLCRSTLDHAGQKKSQDMTSDIKDMEEGLQSVLEGEIDSWELYEQAMKELRLQHSTILIREGRKDVMKLGEKLKILNPFSWLLDEKYAHLEVEHIFTEVSVEGQGAIEMNKILITKMPSGELLPDSVIITGTPGIGKSSLFRFLVYDWLSGSRSMHGMGNVDLLIPVELRHVSSSDVKDLIKHEILFHVAKQLNTDDVLSSLQNVSLLWMLDGYDEAKETTRDVVKEICRKFPDSRILITTRPEFTYDIEKILSDIGRSRISLTLTGFSKENMLLCAEKLITVSVMDINERESQLNGFLDFMERDNRSNLDIMKVPLFISVMLVLWLDCSDEIDFIRTMSELYNVLLDHIINKIIVRESYKKLSDRRGVLVEKVRKFLDELGRVLWRKSFEETLKPYEVDFLEDKCKEFSLPFIDTMSAFFVLTERTTPSGITEEFTIIHRTLKEFLIARAFCHEMISKDQDVFTTEEKWLRSAREILSDQDPNSFEFSQCFASLDFDNLKKEKPNVIKMICQNQNKEYPMATRDFFFAKYYSDMEPLGNYIEEYDMTNEGIYSSEKQVTNNYWCYLRNKMSGFWLIFLIGYMNIKNAFTEERSEQLAFIFFRMKNIFSGDYELWNLSIKEANNELYQEKIFQYIGNINWSMFHCEGIKDAKELLDHVKPNSLWLHYKRRTSIEPKTTGYNNLLNSVKIFKGSFVDLNLDLRYFLPSGKTPLRLITQFLDILLKEENNNRLVTLISPINGSHVAILQKAINLHKLTISFHGKGFTQLAQLIRNLPSLCYVNIAIDLKALGKDCKPIFRQQKTHLKTHKAHLRGYRAQIPHIRRKKVDIDVFVLQNVFRLSSQSLSSFLQTIPFRPKRVIVQGNVTSVNERAILNYTRCILKNIESIKKLSIWLEIFPFELIEKQKLECLNKFVSKSWHNKEVEFVPTSDGIVQPTC